ncbi:MAG TPA: methylmalonyl-CoA mutase family protein, partial [Spirillospora sp.]|nr:methylmalonyl-CoA mutase family protein [Spirillospora sp.]
MSDQTFAADELSFDEFTRPTYDEWYAAALDSIGGADFEKLLTTRTYEGLTLQPLYRREDLAPIAHLLTLPGFTPFVRGVRASGHVAQPWLIAQELPAPTPEAFNAALRHDLAQGQNAIKLILDQPGRAGLDPDQAENPGQGGLSLASLDDVAQAFAGIDLSALPLHAEAGASFLPLLALLAAYYQQQGQSLADWRGSITADPLGELVQNGTLPAPLEKLYDEMAQITAWAVQNAPQLATIGIACVPYHNGGANAVQELAFAIATGVEYLREMLVRDLTIELAAPRMIFSFAIGAQFFIEIAKLRAARLLWSRVIGAFGGSESAQRMRLHTCTGRLNKTVYDPYVNILRTTLEAFAGVIGGSDSLHIAPFDESANLP